MNKNRLSLPPRPPSSALSPRAFRTERLRHAEGPHHWSGPAVARGGRGSTTTTTTTTATTTATTAASAAVVVVVVVVRSRSSSSSGIAAVSVLIVAAAAAAKADMVGQAPNEVQRGEKRVRKQGTD